MHDMDRSHRLTAAYLRRQRRKARRRGEQAEADQITQILEDELALCALSCEVEDRQETNAYAAAGFPLLVWLLANWPAIMEMIQALIQLFSTEDALE